jgi:THAP4-like, heme-binding beta-barrel domain
METITVTASPKPFLSYHQATSDPLSGKPLHTETGYIRFIDGSDDVELTLAQPTGFVEIYAGTVTRTADGVRIAFQSQLLGRTPTSKEVTEVERNLVIANGVLTYELLMAAMGEPLQLHLSAKLNRQR